MPSALRSADGAGRKLRNILPLCTRQNLLRRILTRRGITSTAGLLSAVLAGPIPRDLPAATALKIVSATQASTATSATSTTLAAAALLVAVAAPVVYQQNRIAALQGEIQSMQQRASVASLAKSPVAKLAEERGTAEKVAAKRPGRFDVSSSEDSSDSAPITVEGGH